MLEPFNFEQTTLSTCFEVASEVRIRVPYRTAGRVRELEQTFAIRILSMLVLREELRVRASSRSTTTVYLVLIDSNHTSLEIRFTAKLISAFP